MSNTAVRIGILAACAIAAGAVAFPLRGAASVPPEEPRTHWAPIIGTDGLPATETFEQTLGAFVKFSIAENPTETYVPGKLSVRFTATTSRAGDYAFDCYGWERTAAKNLTMISGNLIHPSTLQAGANDVTLPVPAEYRDASAVSCYVRLNWNEPHTVVSDSPTYQMAPAGWEDDQMIMAPEGLPKLSENGQTGYAYSVIFGNAADQ